MYRKFGGHLLEVSSSRVLVGIAPAWASAAVFGIIAAGGVGSLLVGRMVDRIGRTAITIASMLMISGMISLAIGFFFSKLCPPDYTGTALTLQTSLGFILTLASIRLIPVVQAMVGWQYAFAILAIGPATGIWAMVALRRSPAAVKMAAGRR